MMNGVQAVIVRLHAKRKAVADCDQTIATQQLLWRLDSQAALLEEYVNGHKSELEEYARRSALEEAEELREKQKAMEELRAAVAQPCFRRVGEALDACDANALPEDELASAKQEFNARIQMHMEEQKRFFRVENEKAQAARREEQTQAVSPEQYEGLIARAYEVEMREWTTQQTKKHKAASKGGAKLGLFREIRHPKE